MGDIFEQPNKSCNEDGKQVTALDPRSFDNPWHADDESSSRSLQQTGGGSLDAGAEGAFVLHEGLGSKVYVMWMMMRVPFLGCRAISF